MNSREALGDGQQCLLTLCWLSAELEPVTAAVGSTPGDASPSRAPRLIFFFSKHSSIACSRSSAFQQCHAAAVNPCLSVQLSP